MIVNNASLFADARARAHMGSLTKEDVSSGAKQWAAEEGKALGSGVVSAGTQKIQELILFGKKGPPATSLYEDPPPYQETRFGAGGGMSPMAIGGIALAGVLVIALVASR